MLGSRQSCVAANEQTTIVSMFKALWKVWTHDHMKHLGRHDNKRRSANEVQSMCALQASMQHTDRQMEDIMHLRKLFYHKLGQLARERKELLTSMSQCRVDMNHVSDKFASMTKWSDQLRENALEEYRVYLQNGCIFYRGVSQEDSAICLVACHLFSTGSSMRPHSSHLPIT